MCCPCKSDRAGQAAHQLDVEVVRPRQAVQRDGAVDDLRDERVVQARGVAPHRRVRAHAPDLRRGKHIHVEDGSTAARTVWRDDVAVIVIRDRCSDAD